MFQQTFAFLSGKMEWTRLINIYKEIELIIQDYYNFFFICLSI